VSVFAVNHAFGMEPRVTRTRSPDAVKKRLIEAARKVFARSGFHGGRVQEIAEIADANVSLISHHFGGKAGLYRACLADFAQARLETLEPYLTPARSVEELRVRLELLIDHLLQEHLKASEVVTILLRDIDESDLWGKDLEAQLFSFTTKLAGFFADARAFLRADVEPLAAASLIYLAFSGLVQVSAHVERMSGIRVGDAEVRKRIVRQTLDIVLNGVLR
jgi:AcrR family transcriptional regulator